MSVNLQLVAEAAFTNPLIVAMCEVAAANGDEVTPTIFLSIESDELRHMANGYQTIVSVVDDPDNMKYLQTDIDNAFWINHKFITPFVGAAFDYFAKHKATPWAQTWDKWVYEDWGGIWLGRLSRFGVQTPAHLADAKKDAYWAHHYAYASAWALWPLVGVRFELPKRAATSTGWRTTTPAGTTRSATSSSTGGRTATRTRPTTCWVSTSSSTARSPSTSAGSARCRRSCRPSTTA